MENWDCASQNHIKPTHNQKLNFLVITQPVHDTVTWCDTESHACKCSVPCGSNVFVMESWTAGSRWGLHWTWLGKGLWSFGVWSFCDEPVWVTGRLAFTGGQDFASAVAWDTGFGCGWITTDTGARVWNGAGGVCSDIFRWTLLWWYVVPSALTS